MKIPIIRTLGFLLVVWLLPHLAWGSFPTKGKPKLLCLLVEFPDQKFSIDNPKEAFSNLFNQVGYAKDGAKGSVRDYFYECSYGQLDLQVDVVGPYTTTENMAYYGGNSVDEAGKVTNRSSKTPTMVKEIIKKANADVDFSQYNNDAGDKIIEGLYVIYAGYDESNGGPADAIWSHTGRLATGMGQRIDENGSIYYIKTYACSSELRGVPSNLIATIGIICHETGHLLGAPDYYQVGQERADRTLKGTGVWDLQADGGWGGDPKGSQPAHPNPYTKIYTYGWAEAIDLDADQEVILAPSTTSKNAFYRIKTNNENEFFLLENRQKIGFDASLPGSGLLIYHAKDVKTSFAEDNNATHPQKLYVVSANATTPIPTEDPISYGEVNAATCPWSEATQTTFSEATTPAARAWDGTSTKAMLTNIRQNLEDKTMTFYCRYPVDLSKLPMIPTTGTETAQEVVNAATSQTGIPVLNLSITADTLNDVRIVDKNTDGTTTLTIGETVVTVPHYYDLGVAAEGFSLILNTNALPQISKIDVNDGAFTVTLSDCVNDKLTYILEGATQPTGQPWVELQRKTCTAADGNRVTLSPRADKTEEAKSYRFYRIVVTD